LTACGLQKKRRMRVIFLIQKAATAGLRAQTDICSKTEYFTGNGCMQRKNIKINKNDKYNCSRYFIKQ